MDHDCLEVSVDDAVAILTLNRPEAGNAIDLDMSEALFQAADRLHQDPSVRVVLLRARGKLFSGGGDIGAFASAVREGPEQASGYMGQLASAFHRGLKRLLEVDAPLVVAAQGPAAGAGMSLVLGADFSYLAPRARLIPAYTGIGMSGDGGITWLLPRLCGLRRATELLMLNKPIDPAEAVSLGLATEVLPEQDEAFQEAVLARARQIAAGPRRAFSMVRALLRSSPANSFEQQLDLEASGMARLAGGRELPEGLQAMSGKRKPVFS